MLENNEKYDIHTYEYMIIEHLSCHSTRFIHLVYLQTQAVELQRTESLFNFLITDQTYCEN